MTPFLLHHAAAPLPLPTVELQLLAAEARALREARDAVAGDTVATYGRIDGLVLEREERLCTAYREHLAATTGLSPSEQAAEAQLRG